MRKAVVEMKPEKSNSDCFAREESRAEWGIKVREALPWSGRGQGHKQSNSNLNFL